MFRFVLSAAVLASVRLTGPLFSAPLSVALYCAALTYVVSGRVGFLAFAGAFSFSIFQDLSRLQPQFVALCLAMPAGFSVGFGRHLLAAHLGALWFFAGLWKLISPAYFRSAFFPRTIAALLPAEWARLCEEPGVAVALNGVAAFAEFLLGALALAVVLTRHPWGHLVRWIRFGGMALHLSILGLLVLADWNHSVWPWNAFCVGAVVVAFAPGRSPTGRLNVAVAALWLYPALYPLGLADPYGAWNLYSDSSPSAQICGREGSKEVCHAFRPEAAPGVPLPPMHHLLEREFVRVCTGGQELRTSEPRWFVQRRRPVVKRTACP